MYLHGMFICEHISLTPKRSPTTLWPNKRACSHHHGMFDVAEDRLYATNYQLAVPTRVLAGTLPYLFYNFKIRNAYS
jgi:hypothetical protein